MTQKQTFTYPDTIVYLDGFIYLIDPEGGGSISDYTIGNIYPGEVVLNPPFKCGTVDHAIIACNNPSIPVPQLPELRNDISEENKARIDALTIIVNTEFKNPIQKKNLIESIDLL